MLFCDPCNKILKWDASDLDRIEEICSICGDPGTCNDTDTDLPLGTPNDAGIEDELISGGQEQIRQFREAQQTRIDEVEAEFRKNNPPKTAWERLNGEDVSF